MLALLLALLLGTLTVPVCCSINSPRLGHQALYGAIARMMRAEVGAAWCLRLQWRLVRR